MRVSCEPETAKMVISDGQYLYKLAIFRRPVWLGSVGYKPGSGEGTGVGAGKWSLVLTFPLVFCVPVSVSYTYENQVTASSGKN
jgi:hypothetical protein